MRPSSLELEPGGASVLLQILPEETSVRPVSHSVSPSENAVAGHLPLGCAEVCGAFIREADTVPAVTRSVSATEHPEPGESVGTRSVCPGCRIQTSGNRRSVT